MNVFHKVAGTDLNRSKVARGYACPKTEDDMRTKPAVFDDAMVALFLGVVVLGHAMYFVSEGLPSLLWRG